MTSPINNFQDILDAMEREPALRDALRRHILTDELLQMPVRLERVEQAIGTLKEDVSTLKEDMSDVKSRLNTIGGTVSRLAGHDYESHASRNVERILRRERGIYATIFSTERANGALASLLKEAESQGRVNAKESDELDQADLVLVNDNTGEYLLAEVSITIEQHDIDRALERAALLHNVTGQPVTPLTIGAREEPDLDKGPVQMLLVPEPSPQAMP